MLFDYFNYNVYFSLRLSFKLLSSNNRDRSNCNAASGWSRKGSRDTVASSKQRAISADRKKHKCDTSTLMTTKASSNNGGRSRSPSPPPVLKSTRSQSLDVDVLPSVRYNPIPSIKEEDVFAEPYPIRPRTNSDTTPDKQQSNGRSGGSSKKPKPAPRRSYLTAVEAAKSPSPANSPGNISQRSRIEW